MTTAAPDRARLLACRQMIMMMRGEDASAIGAEREAMLGSVSDPDAASWTFITRGYASLLADRATEATEAFRRGISLSAQNTVDARMGLVHAALWAADASAAREAREEAVAEGWAGVYIDAMRDLAAGGVSALEGRPNEATTSFVRAIRALGRNGSSFEVARAQLDALIVLPDEPAIRDWADEARGRFERLGARPFLARLEQALAARVA